jgi:hypothetical protein
MPARAGRSRCSAPGPRTGPLPNGIGQGVPFDQPHEVVVQRAAAGGGLSAEGEIGDAAKDRPGRFPEAREGQQVLHVGRTPVDKGTVRVLGREATRDRTALPHDREEGGSTALARTACERPSSARSRSPGYPGRTNGRGGVKGCSMADPRRGDPIFRYDGFRDDVFRSCGGRDYRFGKIRPVSFMYARYSSPNSAISIASSRGTLLLCARRGVGSHQPPPP